MFEYNIDIDNSYYLYNNNNNIIIFNVTKMYINIKKNNDKINRDLMSLKCFPINNSKQVSKIV